MLKVKESRALVIWLCFALAGIGIFWALAGRINAMRAQAIGQRSAPPAPAAAASPQRALLTQYCVTCHNDRVLTAGLALDKLDTENIGPHAEVWEKVLLKVRSGQMPPAARRRPDQATLDAFTEWLETELDRAAAARPEPGRVAIHRLNRTEYANAIRDLLALEIDSRSILIDEEPGESGFDNVAAELSVSTALVERYMSTARRISRLAVGDPKVLPVFETYTVPKMLVQDGRVSEDLPFGSRGGFAIRHIFPVNGEYVVKVRLLGQLYDYLIGLGRPHPMEVRLDGKLIKRFTVGGDAPGRPAPESFSGNIAGDPEWEEYMHSADAALEVRFPAQAGTRIVGVSFAEHTPEPEGVLQPTQTGASGLHFNHIYDGNPYVRTISIGGPYRPGAPGDTPSRRKIFVCRPERNSEEQACAEKILSNLARRAYRRPVTKEDVQTLVEFYNAGRKGATFDAGIQLALTRTLVDPEFLFRIVRDPKDSAPGTVYRLDDLALASRLSFFLWSSIPDDELLEIAVAGKLKDPAVLERQVRRMLSDPRSNALIHNFTNQWLNLGKLRGAAPDPDSFPDFDENLRQAFQQETELFIESQVRGDRSIVELISANYTFVNERLARHYQIPNVYGNAFRRVTFDAAEDRGGLLGQGSILTVTSYANRASPTLRGKWLLDNILGTPPPPPPPNVPNLKESAPGDKPVSLREQLAQHLTNPACTVCHVHMDPLGFSFNSFDGIGKRHTANEDGTPIDASASLPDGTKLDGLNGLREFLLSRRQRFAAALSEKLLAYAIGRTIDHSDLPAIRKITREAAANDHRWSSLIIGIVRSIPFQMNAAAETATAFNGPKIQLRRPIHGN